MKYAFRLPLMRSTELPLALALALSSPAGLASLKYSAGLSVNRTEN